MKVKIIAGNYIEHEVEQFCREVDMKDVKVIDSATRGLVATIKYEDLK